jgi:aminopeptidase N
VASGGFTDKGLHREAVLGGWAGARRRVFAEAGAEPRYAPDRACRIERAAVTLEIDPGAQTLRGQATFDLVGFGRAGDYALDLDEVEIDRVAGPEGDPLPFVARDGRLRFAAVPRVTVEWHGSPRRGLYFVGPTPAAPSRPWQAWSQGQDEDAHYFMPCHDAPGVKHAWRVTILAPEAYTVVGNGAPVEVAAARSRPGWRTWQWSVPDPMPAYLFTVVVARLDVHEDPEAPVPTRYLVPTGTSPIAVARAFGRTAEMLRFLSERFVPYPWARYDQVVVEEFIFGGMENLGATTLFEGMLTDERAAIDNDMDDLVVHELAHQWFGDLVTCRDWSQGWLNEGWATAVEALWLEHARGRDAADWHRWEAFGAYLQEDADRYRRPIVSYLFREPIDLFDRHLYEKASLVLHALRGVLGDEATWAGTREYLRRNRGGAVHTRDFQAALEDVSGRNLDRFFDQFVHAPGHPALTIMVSEAGGTWSIAVKQTQSGDGVPAAYALPLSVALDGEIHALPIDSRERTFAIRGSAQASIAIDASFATFAEIAIEAPVPVLTAMARAPGVVGRVRALRALAKDGSPAAVAELARSLREDPWWGVRAEAADLLGARGGDVAAAALLGALGDPEARARRVVVAAAGKLRRADATAALEALAEDPSLHVEGEVARALGKLRAPGARARCERLLARESWLDLLAARGAEGLGHARDAAVLPVLLRQAESDRPARARAAACAALGRLGDEVDTTRTAVVERLVQLAEDPSLRVACAAITALGALRDARANEVLHRVHGSAADGRSRRLAWEALASIAEGRSTTDALHGLRADLDALAEENRRLRARVERVERS